MAFNEVSPPWRLYSLWRTPGCESVVLAESLKILLNLSSLGHTSPPWNSLHISYSVTENSNKFFQCHLCISSFNTSWYLMFDGIFLITPGSENRKLGNIWGFPIIYISLLRVTSNKYIT